MSKKFGLENLADAGIEEEEGDNEGQDEVIEGTEKPLHFKINSRIVLFYNFNFLCSLVLLNALQFLIEKFDIRHKTHILNPIYLQINLP